VRRGRRRAARFIRFETQSALPDGPDGAPDFRALPRLSSTDVADALQVARARILRYLEQRRVITLDAPAIGVRLDGPHRAEEAQDVSGGFGWERHA
jgi:hypothetical protein